MATVKRLSTLLSLKYSTILKMSKIRIFLCLAYPGAGFMHNHFSNSDAKNERDLRGPCLVLMTCMPLPEQSTHSALKLSSPANPKVWGLNVRGHRL